MTLVDSCFMRKQLLFMRFLSIFKWDYYELTSLIYLIFSFLGMHNIRCIVSLYRGLNHGSHNGGDVREICRGYVSNEVSEYCVTSLIKVGI
jgi:hypothetical protein